MNPTYQTKLQGAKRILGVLAAILVAFAAFAITAQDAHALTDDQKASRVVGTAKSLVGKPYEPAGNPVLCSSRLVTSDSCLSRLAYKSAGVTLPHTFHGQIGAGKVVRTARPGDLLFFDVNRDGRYGDARDHSGVHTGGGYVVHGPVLYSGRVTEQHIHSFAAYLGPPMVVRFI